MSPSDQEVHILVVFDPPIMSNVLIDSPPPPPIQVYNRCQTSHHPPVILF